MSRSGPEIGTSLSHRSALSEPPRKTSDVAFPHLRPSQIRHVKVPERLVEPTHLVTTGGERKPKVIVLSCEPVASNETRADLQMMKLDRFIYYDQFVGVA